jgi:hypothetical protein
MQITKGKQTGALKVVVYGPEGIGKSTFASKFPSPVFIDTEGSTKWLDVARYDRPLSWAELMDEVADAALNATQMSTLVIDTADWAEKLATEAVLAKFQKKGIEDFGYGKGYVYVGEEFGKLIDLLTDINNLGVNIVLTAHAAMRKFEQPDEMGSYDRWEMKLSKKVAPMLKEWADLVLFANYKTFVVTNGENKRKAQGGERVMYTAHHPCWDAKNRFGLLEEMRLDFTNIAHLFKGAPVTGNLATEQKPHEPPVVGISHNETKAPDPPATKPPESLASVNQGRQNPPAVETGMPVSNTPVPPQTPSSADWDGIPIPLAKLMLANEVTPQEVSYAVFKNGHFPEGMRISEYPADYIDGVLIAAWPKVYAKILKNREEAPF